MAKGCIYWFDCGMAAQAGDGAIALAASNNGVLIAQSSLSVCAIL
jgi:hypothetical protein